MKGSTCTLTPNEKIPRPVLVASSHLVLTPSNLLAHASSATSERISMPPPEHAATPATQAPRDTPPAPSRRSMLRGAASAGAAGLALTALAASPALAASQHVRLATPEADHVPDHIADGEALVVHVRNVRSGEMDVYRGTSHVRLHDRALAARLARA